MKVLVHFGQAKTGTTALQHTFSNQRDALARRGILYPKLEMVQHNHGLLAIGFKDPETLHPNFLRMCGGDISEMQRAGERSWKSLKRQVDEASPDLLILSAEEYFSQLTEAAAGRFKDRLVDLGAAAGDISTCVYLRDPASQFLSLIAQNAVSMMPLSRQLRLHAKGRLAAMQQAFPLGPTVCAYDRRALADGDIVKDFVTRFVPEVADMPLVAPERSNVSLSGEGTAIVLWYRDQLLPERSPEAIYQVRRIRKILARIEEEDGISRKARLRPEVQQAIIRGSDELPWLQETYGVTFPSIDYAQIDGTQPKLPAPTPATIDQFLDLDIEVRDHLLARLVQDMLPSLPKRFCGSPSQTGNEDEDDSQDSDAA